MAWREKNVAYWMVPVCALLIPLHSLELSVKIDCVLLMVWVLLVFVSYWPHRTHSTPPPRCCTPVPDMRDLDCNDVHSSSLTDAPKRHESRLPGRRAKCPPPLRAQSRSSARLVFLRKVRSFASQLRQILQARRILPRRRYG